MRIKYFWIATMATLCAAVAGQANTIDSFTGVFAGDDSVQFFSIDLGPNSSFTAKTFGYAGGVNGNGQTIEEGGFDPALALFDPTGNLVAINDDGGNNVNTDPVTGQQFDSFLSEVDLTTPGIYTLALTVAPNLAQDNLGQPDTFPYPSGTGNFTCAMYGGASASSPFCDITGDERNGHWAVDISGTNVISITPITATPEPGSLPVVVGIGVIAMVVRRVRGRRRAAA